MSKQHLNLSVDSELIKRAKERFANISDIIENAIRDKLEIIQVDTSVNKCNFCKREEKKATADNLEGLTWLCPDEVWICSRCLREKIKLQIMKKT